MEGLCMAVHLRVTEGLDVQLHWEGDAALDLACLASEVHLEALQMHHQQLRCSAGSTL